MLQRRPLTLFFIRVLLVYAALMIPWPGLQRAYGAFYRAGWNVLFTSFGADGQAQFLPLRPPQRGQDTTVILKNLRTRFLFRLTTSNRYMAFAPTVLLLALILATPIPWSRRWRALLWGLLLVHGFIAARMTLILLEAFTRGDNMALWEPGPFWRGVVTGLILTFACSVVVSFAVPVLIWILVMFCGGDWPVVGGLVGGRDKFPVSLNDRASRAQRGPAETTAAMPVRRRRPYRRRRERRT